jgi:hypothetical protein
MIGFSSSLFVFISEIILGLLVGWGFVLVVRDLMVQLSWVY